MAGSMDVAGDTTAGHRAPWLFGVLFTAIGLAGCGDSGNAPDSGISSLVFENGVSAPSPENEFYDFDRSPDDVIQTSPPNPAAYGGFVASGTVARVPQDSLSSDWRSNSFLPDAEDSQSGSELDGSSSPPALRFDTSSPLVEAGEYVSLSWNAEGATSCQASGGWSGQRAVSGSQMVGPLTSATSFSLSCRGSGGTALEMASVLVAGPVTVNWTPPEKNVDGSELVDLAGYKVYYGENSGEYSHSVDITDPSAESYSVVLPSGDYYFAMTAYDSEGHESPYSNEVLRSRP